MNTNDTSSIIWLTGLRLLALNDVKELVQSHAGPDVGCRTCRCERRAGSADAKSNSLRSALHRLHTEVAEPQSSVCSLHGPKMV